MIGSGGNLPDGVRALVVDGEGTVGRDGGGQSDEGSERSGGLHDDRVELVKSGEGGGVQVQ